MKKLIPVLVCALLIVSLCTVFVSAETTSLILKDAAWQFKDDGQGNNCTADTKTEGKVTVSALAGWPHIRCDFTKEQIITATVKDASLKYDFTVETGATNITLIFAKDGATGYEFPLSNSALKLTSDQIDSGSGDIKAGHYSGTLKLSDLIEADRNYAASEAERKFDKSYVEDGKLTFAGLIIYATNGATVKVDALEVVTAGAPAETSKETSSETSKTETSKATATSSAAGTASTANTSSTAPATSGTTPPTGDNNTGMIIALVLGAIAIVAAGSVITAKVRH